jgi:hypothetical protein
MAAAVLEQFGVPRHLALAQRREARRHDRGLTADRDPAADLVAGRSEQAHLHDLQRPPAAARTRKYSAIDR